MTKVTARVPVVLYIEDEEFDTLFMRRAMSKAGLDVTVISIADGRRAIEYLGSGCPETPDGISSLPDLVLLDLGLPVCSGLEVLQWIRRQPALKDLPVVVFTSSVRDQDRITARKLGASDYVQKPGSALEFQCVVEELRHWLAPAAAPHVTATEKVES